jgi:hypothetical protein
MSRKFSSTISSVIHCQPSLGLGRAIALFAFEGTYRNGCGKSVNVGILGAIAFWLNSDQLVQSGRCKCFIAPT